MKKIVLILSILILGLNLSFLGQQTTYADSTNYDNIAVGQHTITAKALHADSNEASGAAAFISEAVTLTVSESGVELTFTVPSNDMASINGMQIEGVSPTKNGEQWTYKMTSLKPLLKANVQYEVPALNMKHDVPFRFSLEGLDQLPEKQEPEVEQPEIETPEEPKEETPETDGQPEVDEGENEEVTEDEDEVLAEEIQLAEGLYSIDISYINAKNGKDSAMARYLADKAYISVEDGKTELYVLVNDNKTVTKLMINDGNSLEEIVSGEQTLVAFGASPLMTEMTGYAEYEAPFNGGTHYGKAEFEVTINKATIQEETKLPISKEQPKEEETPKPEVPQPEKPTPENPEQSTVKGHTIDYVIKHATLNEASAADKFFVKPGILLKKDGKNYLQLTINNWRMIDWLKVNGQSVTVIKEDKNADTAIVQFQVPEDLSGPVQLSMKVTVPGLYETEHDARLVMDPQSLVADKSDQDYLVHVPTTGKDENPIQKPEFGNNQTTNKESGKQHTAGVQSNPQTSDNSNIVFYTVLLLASVGLLVVRYRKGQVN